jgi:hypothetical protein
MATGRSNQLNKQIGEYLVACELARRKKLLVATFSGNVPDSDILAADSKGTSIPIQVKTIRGGSWQFSADDFVQVRFEGKKQILGPKLSPRIPHLLCILVLATEYGADRFFILEWEELRDVAVSGYRKWLASKGGVRPKKYDSLYCAVSPQQLLKFENQWGKVTKALTRASTRTGFSAGSAKPAG